MKNFRNVAIVAVVLVVAAVILSSCLASRYNIIRVLFYPPAPEAREVHSPEGKKVQWQVWEQSLQKYVKEGVVDYSAWQKDQQGLEQTLQKIAELNTQELARDHLLAAYINAYNSFTIKLMLEYLPKAEINGILDIPEDKRWEDPRWNFGGKKVTLNQLEHEMLRAEFIEPRIHFALVCASISCPPLASFAYKGEKIDEQLTEQAKIFFGNPENLKLEEQTVYLSTILDWFKTDFINPKLATELGWFDENFSQKSEDTRLLLFVAKYAPENIAQQLTRNPQEFSISYLEYDWGLNGK